MFRLVLLILICSQWCPASAFLCPREKTIDTTDFCLLKDAYDEYFIKSLVCIETSQHDLNWDCLAGFSGLKVVFCHQKENLTCQGTWPPPTVEILCRCPNSPLLPEFHLDIEEATPVGSAEAPETASKNPDETFEDFVSEKEREEVSQHGRNAHSINSLAKNPDEPNDRLLASLNETMMAVEAQTVATLIFLYGALGFMIALLFGYIVLVVIKWFSKPDYLIDVELEAAFKGMGRNSLSLPLIHETG